MSGEVGVFQAFYEGPWQHPVLLWVAVAVGLAVALAQRGLDPGLRRYCVALALLSATDAWLTTSEVFGIGRLSGAAARLVPLFFVLAGDLRYLLVVTSATRTGGLAPTVHSVAAALGLMLVVPVLSQAVMAALGEGTSVRVLFFVYEVAFVGLTVCLLRFHARARELAWVRRTSHFVIVYYTLWATADAVILLTGSDLGFLLRVVPNVLYYGGLIGALAWHAARAPR